VNVADNPLYEGFGVLGVRLLEHVDDLLELDWVSGNLQYAIEARQADLIERMTDQKT
jgi:hypothetical protein